MRESELSLASYALGLPTWPRTVNKLNQLLVALMGFVVWWMEGSALAAKFGGAYLLGWLAVGLLTSFLSKLSVHFAVYFGTFLLLILTAILAFYFLAAPVLK